MTGGVIDEQMRLVEGVIEVLQRVYGGPNRLDRQAARDVLDHLTRVGMAEPFLFRVLVHKLGGKVEITEADLRDAPRNVAFIPQDRFVSDGVLLRFEARQ